MNITKKIDRYLIEKAKRFKIGDKVRILTKVAGLTKNNLGTIIKIDGEYHYVRPYGRPKDDVIELYRTEIEKA